MLTPFTDDCLGIHIELMADGMVRGIYDTDWGRGVILYSPLPNIPSILIDGGIIMQWTGLQDRNGVDIYEGDIICTEGSHHPDICSGNQNDPHSPGTFHIAIAWDRDVVGWNIDRDNSGAMEGLWNYLVVGNIYQNPDLIPES